ncbi:hypothetical protein ACN9MD_13465 [Stenotrophomonas maltophilia]|jgi:hypothetical protein|uniref:hypothetical protein n=4 Tax=Stenotrophomonas TaxID=40323 RepID=UPI002AA1866C|nr:hypothetical protein [Stenotrophomonas maltophilia]
MSMNGIRTLSSEELALVSGGAQVDTNDLPPIDVRPPGDDGWPDIGPPDIIDPPFDPGPGDGGGGGGGGGDEGSVELSDTWWEFNKQGIWNGDKAGASISATYQPIGLAFNATQTYSIATGTWDTSLSGSFVVNNNTYQINATAADFTFNGYNASYTYNFGAGINISFGVNYDPATNEFKGDLKFEIPYP